MTPIRICLLLLAGMQLLTYGCRVNPASNVSNEIITSTPVTEEEVSRLLSEMHTLADELEAKTANREGKEKDDVQEKLKILDFAIRWLETTFTGSHSPKELTSVFVQVSRIDYSIRNPAGLEGLHKMLVQGSNLVGTSLSSMKLPRISKQVQTRPLGPQEASHEAIYVYNPLTQDFFTVPELAELSPIDVSRLDVSREHPAWFRENDEPLQASGRVDDFIHWMEAGMNEALHAEGDLPMDLTWDSRSVRRVLFMEEIYKSATSAKGVAEDAYKVEWKLKWGDEIHTEAIASRLYTMLGAKATDLSFVGGPGPDEMILILNEADEYEPIPAEDGAERDPATVQQLIQTLEDFYGFDLRPYIHSHGVLTEDNIDYLLRHLPKKGDEDYQPSELIGREWISFLEYSAELKPQKFIIRYDGSRMSDAIACNDRVARGLYIFNVWVSNRDAKDDNNKAYYIMGHGEDEEDPHIVGYREGMHDLGLTFGTVEMAGMVNAMTTGEEFLYESASGDHFLSPQTFICVPEAWSRATWADCRWMARKIASLSESDIRTAVAASRWPDFMQEALVYKLLARRNLIAIAFNLKARLDNAHISAPALSIPLDSPEAIAKAEQHYKIEPGSLAGALAEIQVPAGYRESLLQNGQIVSPENSQLIRLLVQQRHPSGLYERYNRSATQHPTPLRQ